MSLTVLHHPRHSALAICAVVFGLLPSGSDPGAMAAAPVRAVTHTVTIDATSFRPATLTIKPGDSILWVNKDLIPHTATSAAAKDKGGFDSGVIAPGKSWKHTPAKAGTFTYACSFHPTMKGTLSVKK